MSIPHYIRGPGRGLTAREVTFNKHEVKCETRPSKGMSEAGTSSAERGEMSTHHVWTHLCHHQRNETNICLAKIVLRT